MKSKITDIYQPIAVEPREELLSYFHALLEAYKEPSDDLYIQRLQSLSPSERDIFILYIACDYKAGKLADMLYTNIPTASRLVQQIKEKLLS